MEKFTVSSEEDFKKRLDVIKCIRDGTISWLSSSSSSSEKSNESKAAEALFELLRNIEFSSKDDVRYYMCFTYARTFSCTLEYDPHGFPHGSGVVRLKCSNQNCNFRVSFTKNVRSNGNFWLANNHTDKNSLSHSINLGNELSSPCISICVVQKEHFDRSPLSEIVKKQVNNNGKIIQKSLQEIQNVIESQMGFKISMSNLKKVSATKNRASASAELEKMNLLEPMLELMKQDSGLKYLLERKEGSDELKRLIVIPPYTEQFSKSPYNVKLYGIDTAHVKDFKMENNLSEETNSSDIGLQYVVFPNYKLAVISTRFPSNKLMILGFAFIHSENAEDIGTLLKFMVDSDVLLDDETITIISDRSAAINRAVGDKAGKAYHAYCPLHIERNLKHKKWTDHVQLYRNARNATTDSDIISRMNKIQSVCPEMHRYLQEIGNGWQCYLMYERNLQHGNMMYNVMSDNIVEQVFSFLMVERGKSIFEMVSGILIKIFNHHNKIEKEINDRNMEITEHATKTLYSNEEKAKTFLVNCNICWNQAEMSLLSFKVNKESTSRSLAEVKLILRECDCFQWQQSGIPCMHAIKGVIDHNHQRPQQTIALSDLVHIMWKTSFSKQMLIDLPSLTACCLPSHEKIENLYWLQNDGKYNLTMKIIPWDRHKTNNKRILSNGESRSLGDSRTLKPEYPCPNCAGKIVTLKRHFFSKACRRKGNLLNQNQKNVLRAFWEENANKNLLTITFGLEREQINAIFPNFYTTIDDIQTTSSIVAAVSTGQHLPEDQVPPVPPAINNVVTLENPILPSSMFETSHEDTDEVKTFYHQSIDNRKRSISTEGNNKDTMKKGKQLLYVRKSARIRKENSFYKKK